MAAGMFTLLHKWGNTACTTDTGSFLQQTGVENKLSPSKPKAMQTVVFAFAIGLQPNQKAHQQQIAGLSNKSHIRVFSPTTHPFLDHFPISNVGEKLQGANSDVGWG